MAQRERGTTELESVRKIIAIEFGVPSNKSIIDYSAIREEEGLTKPEIYTDEKPTEGGVIDGRLGTISRTSPCETCGEVSWKCPGHFGHIKLAEPVFNVGMIEYLRNIIQCVCIICKKLLIGKKSEEIAHMLQTKHGSQRYAYFQEASRKAQFCDNCGGVAHRITVNKKYGNISVIATPVRRGGVADEEQDKTKKRTDKILSPQVCYDILKSLSDETVAVLGINPTRTRPEDLVIINLAVPPIQVRPSMKSDSSNVANRHDDITGKLVEIIRSNQNLKDTKGNGSLVKSNNMLDDHLCLQLHIATCHNNDNLGTIKSHQKGGKPTKSVAERLESKGGRLRGNLLGKRVDFSGRAVISSDPNVTLYEVGVPLKVAQNLTFPDIVTPNNIGFLARLVKNGSRIYPGASHVIQKRLDDNGVMETIIINLEIIKSDYEIVLEVGDTVERHLVDGDVVLLNRQPSLHKNSFMAHRVHVLRDKSNQTFRINVNITDPYNADFDGDEMNLHVAQSIQTTIELLMCTLATKLFVSAGNGRILNKPKQDSTVGSYIMTEDDVYIDWKSAMNILTYTSRGITPDIPKGMMISGKYIYSQILPKELNLVQKRDDRYKLYLLNGNLLAGRIGSSENSAIVQKLWFQYGGEVTSTFIDDLHRSILKFLMLHGVTNGPWDAQIPKKAHRDIRRLINTKRQEIMTKITEYENDPYAVTNEAFEAYMQESLQSIMGEFSKIVMRNLDPRSGINLTISAGSSGTDVNAVQISGAVGQVIVEQKRIPTKFNNRALPCFAQFDGSPEARGMCTHSFIQGLSVYEFYYQAIAGREGAINTAITTADTGYLQRKFVKFLEDIKNEYDGTVRNANDKIIQMSYGDAGLNNEKIVDQRIKLVKMSNDELLDNYIYTLDELKKITKKYPETRYDSHTNEKFAHKLIKMRNKLREVSLKVGTNPGVLDDTFRMPIDFTQQIINIMSRPERPKAVPIDPYYILLKIREMYSGGVSRIMKFIPETSVVKKRDDQQIKFLIKTYLYDVLSPRRCTHEYKLRQEEFDELIEYYYRTVSIAKAEGGEMVGVLGAQSIGEPTSQANLKSFQKSGTGRTVAGGLIRIKELADIRKKIKTPLMDIVFKPEYRTDMNVVRKIAGSLKYTVMKDVLESISIVYDPQPEKKNSLMNRDGATSIFRASQGKGGCQSEIDGLPWVARMVLSKEKMIERNTTMLEIKMSICRNWASREEDSKGNKKEYKKAIEKITQCAITSNFDNSDTSIIHLRFNARNYNMRTLILFHKMIYETYAVKGIEKIKESKSISEEKYVTFGEGGEVKMEKQYVISTEGINLEELFNINGIDIKNCRCNSIIAINEIYGVEAARAAYIREFNMALASSGTSANHQHIELLADTVTHMGGLISVNRHGANKLDTDPLSRASFEQTVRQLTASAIFGQTDHLRSTSSRIMLGRMFNGGTGSYDLMVDHEKIIQVLDKTTEPKIKRQRRRSKVSELKRR